MKRAKITVIGGGFVGSTAAHWIASKELADVCLIDINGDMAAGKALDLAQSGPVEGFDANCVGGSDYAASANSDVVIITAGIPRKPGMSRDDLLNTNAKIVRECAQNAAKHSPNSILIIVSNPLDAMCHVAMEASGFPKNRVIGMAGVLDGARFRTFIARELNVSVEDVQAFVYGGHGDTMVPLVDTTNIAGVPVKKLIPGDRLAQIVQRTRDGGAEIVGLLKKGSAYYAPSASVVKMVEAIDGKTDEVLPIAAWCTGQYGIDGVYVGVPARLGRQGVAEIVELDLSADELAKLREAGEAIRAKCADLASL